MALTDALGFGPARVTISAVSGSVPISLEIDATTLEQHGITATATRHPVEAGPTAQSEISDNVAIGPFTLRIEGVISNAPVDWFGAATISTTDTAQESYFHLLGDLLSARLVTITTTLLEYPDMVLENISVRRDAGKANALHFSCDAVSVILVELQETGAAQKPVTQSTRNTGTKGAKNAAGTEPATSTSLFAKAWDAL